MKRKLLTLILGISLLAPLALHATPAFAGKGGSGKGGGNPNPPRPKPGPRDDGDGD